MLEDRRESLKLSQTELAQRLGISQSGVSNLEKGNTRFDIFWTEEVCIALELDPLDFLHAYEQTAPEAGGPLLGHDDETDDRSENPQASPKPDEASREDEGAPGEEPLDKEGTNWKGQVYTDPEEQRRAVALALILERRRKKAGPGATKLTQQVVADAIGHKQPFIAKAEHARCKIHMADLEQMSWRIGARLTEVYRANRKTWLQRAGQRRQAGVTSLGWSRGLDLYRPILSYDELGGLLQAGPSKLFDKLDAILGIEQATDAEQRLAEALKGQREADKAAKAEVRELKKVLAALDDPRATAALDLVRKHHPDLDAVQAIATGTSPEPADDLATLKALTHLQLPTEPEVRDAAEALREVADKFAQASVSSVDIAARRTVLLRQALEFHTHRGDGPCPVCGHGTLDTEWHERIATELATEDEELARHQKARQWLEQVRHAARALLGRVAEPVQPERYELDSLDAARTTWQRWTRPPDGDAAFAEHLEAAFGELEATYSLVRDEAATALAQHEDAWAPLAVRLARWVDLARQAKQNEPRVLLVESAYEFMKRTVEQLRDGRMGQLETAARDIWAALKQDSNVDLGKIELKGTATRRRVELYADVDGEDAQALGVMSQGELHALALALFLPRATMDGSPFRFIVLDDPIQAMDPAKVDGFVRVLAKLAENRQVVVFSHDDRLPQAVRQMRVHARILEVCRDANSGVEVTACMDPARRFLDDAFAVAKDPGIAPDVKARVIPGVCRMAVEAAARDAYMARHFAAGDQRVDIEEAWQAAEGTSRRIALALHDDKEADLSGWLDAERWRRPARQIVTRATHDGLTRDPMGAVRDVGRVVEDLKACAR